MNNNIEQQINFLKRHSQFVGEYLEFYQQILTVQDTQKGLINKDTLSILGKAADIDSRLSGGIPLLERNSFYIDDRAVDLCYHKLVSVLEQFQHQMGAEEISKLKTVYANNALKLNVLLRSYVSENNEYFNMLANETKLKRGLLIFIAKTIALPFLETYRELFRPYLAESADTWLRPYCPLCGNLPAMARLDKEVGQRFLWCSVCNSQWNFARIQCPFCLNENQTKLKYFYTKEDEPYRVDVCDQCKKYIKTNDERKLKEDDNINMSTYDMSTVYLDELAEKEGYLSAAKLQMC